MRLSDAIRLGSLLVPEPQAGDINACAITMACKASGGVNNLYIHLAEQWPWLGTTLVPCPCGVEHVIMYNGHSWTIDDLTGSAIIFAPFDAHVMGDCTMTIDQLADWIRSIEPNEPTEETKNEAVPAATTDRVHFHARSI